jgi:hypothetical protein
MNLIEKYRAWKEKQFLKKHGCETREQYNYKYDPDINDRAISIKDYYHGYPYFYCFEDRKHEIYYWDVAIDGVYVTNKWCKENLTGMFRFDFHRATKAPSTANEWVTNELGGGDYIFFACKDPKDYTLFLLRWT